MKGAGPGGNCAGKPQCHEILLLHLGKASIESPLVLDLYDSNALELRCHHEGCGPLGGFVVPSGKGGLMIFDMAAQVELDAVLILVGLQDLLAVVRHTGVRRSLDGDIGDEDKTAGLLAQGADKNPMLAAGALAQGLLSDKTGEI
jgi:hypothetical protein